MSKWKPNQSGNPNGRPKGSKNKVTAAAKEVLSQAIDGYLPNLANDLEQLQPSQRVQAVTNLLRYILPTLKSSDITQTSSGVSFLDLDLDAKLRIIDEVYPDDE